MRNVIVTSPDTDIRPRPSHWPTRAPGSTRCCRPSGGVWTSCLQWTFSGRWWGSGSRSVWSRTRLCSPRWSHCSADGWNLLENVKYKVVFTLIWELGLTGGFICVWLGDYPEECWGWTGAGVGVQAGVRDPHLAGSGSGRTEDRWRTGPGSVSGTGPRPA